MYLVSDKLQFVALSIHKGDECGGWDAYVEIFYSGSKSCKTKPWPKFNDGERLIRDKHDLGSCYGKNFDPNSKKIQFKVKTNHSGPFENDDFCPKKLEIQMSKNERRFESSIMYEWVDLNKNADLIRNARLVQGFTESESETLFPELFDSFEE